ncbi:MULTISPECIES: dipicolinic acid synthetase subunit A [Alkalihalophilus]|uniref:Dipicolinate synthase subunit A n=1 Tax=Alkalihalophilus pseudofirmus (strain ATCC BAA-2126 / JCM 17055 / OF4) TaxID=398511 RepID=D3FTZ4_ALKPO|nr:MULTISPECIES: dipicolinic acid synthetase subunit A [Alkalihalophilus]ADC51975.1 dipicolinate synthase subunit A [Alkalihalophilus pseudofirmus OF4]MEC2073157.1 dipicolinic acid synthetase subunit A [Alkalihalophilus marmarensis]MED1602339.1 dipicolinic acid synthetase subunit A [Alkalihalophilus marmarensis]OLS37521.1 dipicolinic acid synthetase subunit A [Alkalihalophilus pseudofirmus]
MLTGKVIVVIGGDARQLEIIRKLSTLDAKLSLVGFDQLDDGYIGASKQSIDDVKWNKVDAILLPVSGMNNEGEIETIFSNEKVTLTPEMFSQTPQHCTIFSGITNDTLNQYVKKAKRRLVKLMDRDDIAIYNSIPTAEGTIMMAIQHTDITIHSACVAVIGLGRVGMSVARTFDALGANVKVGANESHQLARITEMGLTPFHTDHLKEELADVDICINTVPELIITAKVLAEMPLHALIIDLASKPGGTDFRYAEKRGMKALLAPGLPGIVAPKTAGKILANVLSDLLQGD